MTRFICRLTMTLGCLIVGFVAVASADDSTKPEAPATAAPAKPVASSTPALPGELLLPNTTQGYISIANVDNMIDHYNRTQLGKLTSDPVMEPFTKDVRRQFENRWSGVHERLGLTLQELREVPGGEVCVALIEPREDDSALVVIADVTGKHDKAKHLIETVSKNLAEQGSKRTEIKVEDSAEPVLQFLIPVPEEDRLAEGSKLKGTTGSATESNDLKKSAAAEEAPRYSYYALAGNLLIVCDDLDVLKGILKCSVGKGKPGERLADVPGFKMVMDRCKTDASDVAPQIRWFIHPVGYAAAARAGTPAEKRRKGKSVLEVMKNQGFGAVKGVGGYAGFSQEGFDLVHRTAVYAPAPYVNSMKMLVFLNGKDYMPQPWVPRDISTYSTFYFDALNAFDNFGPLFNELYGGGEDSAWNDVLRGLKEDANGPQIDLRDELVTKLGQRITVLTDYTLPISTSSERLLFAIETNDEKGVAAAIEKALKNEPTMKKREVDGRVVWEMVDEPEADEAVPEISFGNDLPGAMPPPKPKKIIQKEKPLLPHASVTVADGHLFVASHMDFLQKVLKKHETRERLSSEIDFQMIDAQIQGMPTRESCGRFFSRTDEEYRPTYELIRQNKMPESESMLGRLLNGLFGEPKKKGVVRQQKIDGSELPEYDVVRHYLGPAGMQVTAEKDGWFLKGFTLNKEQVQTGKQDDSKKDDVKKEAKPAEKTEVKAETTK